jgi:hypothetical protein
VCCLERLPQRRLWRADGAAPSTIEASLLVYPGHRHMNPSSASKTQLTGARHPKRFVKEHLKLCDTKQQDHTWSDCRCVKESSSLCWRKEEQALVSHKNDRKTSLHTGQNPVNRAIPERQSGSHPYYRNCSYGLAIIRFANKASSRDTTPP